MEAAALWVHLDSDGTRPRPLPPSFDAIYAEGGYYNLTFHPRVGYGSGSPARVAAVEGLIKYAKRHEGVRFVSMLELAEWCLKRPTDWRRDWSGQ